MFPQFKTILVATDFSPTSEHALEYARALATSFGGTLHLLHVVPDPVMASAWAEAYAYDLTALGERLRLDAERQLTEKAQTIRDVAVTTEAVVGSPAAVIALTAADRAADLIVMGTHGRSGVKHLFMGSVAERVVRSAPCPVLTVREAIAAARDPHRPAELRAVQV
jgi:nucleotide-binding universal stress UspA family protein